MMKTRSCKPTSQWIPVAAFLVLSAGITLLGILYHHFQAHHIQDDARQQLDAIADLKVDQIVRWRQERLADATVIQQNAIVVNSLCAYLAGDRSREKELKEWMASMRVNYDYLDVLLVDEAGQVLLAEGVTEPKTGASLRSLLLESMVGGHILMSDFHQADHVGLVHLDLVIPMTGLRRQGEAPGAGTCRIALVMQIDPSRFLYPLIQLWPSPSASAETLLVRRDGDHVLFLNELRHQKGPALSIRLPLDASFLPAAMAVAGKTGFVEGMDYRHQPVLSALRQIPGTPLVHGGEN
ncbi:MAG: cache domain-containing protein [Lentisphaerota bacterium]